MATGNTEQNQNRRADPKGLHEAVVSRIKTSWGRWAIKITLGWLCYWPLMWCPWWARSSSNRVYMWLLERGGFYAHDTGYKNWKSRVAC